MRRCVGLRNPNRKPAGRAPVWRGSRPPRTVRGPGQFGVRLPHRPGASRFAERRVSLYYYIQTYETDVMDAMAQATADPTKSEMQIDRMAESAREASEFLKALAHESRLMILCNLLDGEKSVGELEAFLSLRQSTVSQQLARLRLEGLVAARRDGKTIYYSIADDKARIVIGVLYNTFCGGKTPLRS